MSQYPPVEPKLLRDMDQVELAIIDGCWHGQLQMIHAQLMSAVGELARIAREAEQVSPEARINLQPKIVDDIGSQLNDLAGQLQERVLVYTKYIGWRNTTAAIISLVETPDDFPF